MGLSGSRRRDGLTPPHIQLRDANENDSANLAILADAATRRLISWLWNAPTNIGQSSFEVGRETIRSVPGSLSHHSRWRVAESDGRVAGATNSYLLAPVDHVEQSSEVGEVLRPLTELKAVAEGTWYVSVASVYPEFRSQGVGRALLGGAERQARLAGTGTLTLLVGSFNIDARRLYGNLGFEEWQRRPFVSFPGSDEAGEWILMAKEVAS